MMVRFSYIFFIIAEETPDNTETMIQLLVDAGADVNHKDNEGYTPLMINGNYWVVNNIGKYHMWGAYNRLTKHMRTPFFEEKTKIELEKVDRKEEA